MLRFAALGVLVGCIPACAWGPEGHSLVARIAESELTLSVRIKVQEILGPGQTMASVSTWADRVRNSRPETGPWHYIDIPINKRHLDMQRDCPAGNCVIAKIEELRTVLNDPAAPHEKRREALMFIIHFVGDMHQPLHCSNNKDHGGNDVPVVFNDRPGKLHGLWDGLLLSQMGTEDALLPRLTAEAERHRKKWAKGTVEQWAEQIHKSAQKVVYGKLPKRAKSLPAANAAFPNPPLAAPVSITPAYEQAADPLIATELEKAGVRLAAVLNSTLQ